MSLDIVEKMVGHRWIEDWVHIMRNNFGRVAQDIPPLASRWLRAKDELAAAELTNEPSFSPATLYTIQLGENMSILSDTPGFDQQLALLRGHDSFYTSCFRLTIAAAYVQRDIPLTLSSQPAPDIQLHTPMGTIPVITQPVAAQSFAQLSDKVIKTLESTLGRLPQGGIIYLELPIPPEHITALLPQIKGKNNLSIPRQVALVLAAATPMKRGVEYSFMPLFNTETYNSLLLEYS